MWRVALSDAPNYIWIISYPFFETKTINGEQVDYSFGNHLQ